MSTPANSRSPTVVVESYERQTNRPLASIIHQTPDTHNRLVAMHSTSRRRHEPLCFTAF